MMRSYTMRLNTTRKQSAILIALIAQFCELYNICLEHRQYYWKQGRKQVSYYDQQKELKELRANCEEYRAISPRLQRDPLRRIDRAFTAFLRCCKSMKCYGYPRFKSRERYNSFTVDAQSFKIRNNTVSITKLGTFKTKTRCKISGIPKQLVVKHVGNKWNAVVMCDIGAAPEKVAVLKAVGIDVGLTSLVTLSDGSEIANPRWTKQSEVDLAEANRELSRKKKSSRNRAKARDRLRRVHQAIVSKRRSYLHDISRWLVNNYDLIAYERLNIKQMVEQKEKKLGKSIMDAAWRELLYQIVYKAEEAGKYAIAVNPRGTSQTCSKCSAIVKKELWQRIHDCPNCGLKLGRDHNAALNILALGESAVGVST